MGGSSREEIMFYARVHQSNRYYILLRFLRTLPLHIDCIRSMLSSAPTYVAERITESSSLIFSRLSAFRPATCLAS